MEFALAPQQTMLRDSLRAVLQPVCTVERVLDHIDSPKAYAEDVWSAISDMGIPAIIIDQSHGGIEANLLDAAIVAQTLGEFAAPVPYVASSVIVSLALMSAGSAEQQSNWLPRLANGEITAGAALSEQTSRRLDAGVRATGNRLNGRCLFVIDFGAELYLVADDNRQLYLVPSDAPGLTQRRLTTVDKTRQVGELVFEDVEAERLPGSTDSGVCDRIVHAGQVMLAADSLGAAETMLQRSVDYSKERIQFGRPIGSFQAVKHLCADMKARLEPCHALMWYAAYALESIPDDAPLTACHAKSHLTEIASWVARTAIEVHGGIGFTHELGLHLWFKRIGANRQLLGSPTMLRNRAAELQSLGAAGQ